jgi:hypothetical protein
MAKYLKLQHEPTFVEDDASFYNVRAAAEKYTKNVFHLFEEAKILFPELHAFTIFGKSFGVLFSLPEIPKDKRI